MRHLIKIFLFLAFSAVFAAPRYFVEGGPLFWYPHQSGLDYVVTSKSSSGVIDGSFEDISFDWSVGGRVGAGFLIPSRDFVIYGLWTTFCGSGDGSTSADSVVPIWNSCAADLAYATSAKAKWDVGFNTLDVGMRANFYPRGWLELSPGIGIKTAWIDQTFNIFILDDRLKMENDMWGIGPRFTFDSLWKFNQALGLDVDVAASLLWSCFDVTQKETQSGATLVDLKSDTDNLRAVLEILAGPYYQYTYADFLMRITVGYDAQVFFCQNQFRPLIRGGTNDGNLFFQGVLLNIFFGF